MHHFLCVRFEKFLFVLQTIKRSLEEGRRVNKRDVYYQEIYAFVIIDYFMNRLKYFPFVYSFFVYKENMGIQPAPLF